MSEKLIQERKTALMATLDDCSAFMGYQADTMRIVYAIDKLIEAHLLTFMEDGARLPTTSSESPNGRAT